MAKEWFGWAGTILRVDLKRRKIKKEPLTRKIALKWLGGRGFNQRALWDEIETGIDPLGPRNVISIGAGPLTGTLWPTTGRLNIDYKSPLTGHLGSGSIGGHFGAALKHAGYDQVVITEKADKPVYLWIDDDRVEIKDASHLWGKTTWDTTEAIWSDDGASNVMCIGPAGEHLARVACIVADCFDAQGETGGGAVFGSKHLKAIGIRGTKGVKIADIDKFTEMVREQVRKMYDDDYIRDPAGAPIHTKYGGFTLTGTPTQFLFQSEHSEPIKYYTTTIPGEMWNNYAPDRIAVNTVRLRDCWACVYHCKRFYEVTRGKYTGTRGGNIQFNALSYVGFNNFISNSEDIMYLNNLYNTLGLSVDMGTNQAFLIYLYKIGMITKDDTDGLELDWNNTELLAMMIRKAAYRKGKLGNLLAEGELNASRIIGKGATDEVCHVCGLATSCHSFRNDLGQALAKSTGTRGCDHLRWCCHGPPDYWEEKLDLPGLSDPTTTTHKHIWVVTCQNLAALSDSYVVCKFMNAIVSPIAPLWGDHAADVLNTLTGEGFTWDMLLRIGERIYNMERAFQVREGVYRKHITPPKWFFDRPYPDGRFAGVNYLTREKWNEMMDNYCRYRKWDRETAVPTRAKLEKLGLKYVADELGKNMPYSEWSGPPLWPFEKYPHEKR